MRKRKVIEEEGEFNSTLNHVGDKLNQVLILEVLLDIRDLLLDNKKN